MEDREKIIQLFKNPLVSGYGLEIMSNDRLYSANFQRYRKRVREEENPFIIFEHMSKKVERLFLELAEEVLRVNPKNKQEFKRMVEGYSYRTGGV
ncbi:hypothetical protein SHT67_14155 (plasmid) [Enterococcus faecalis]|uniref:hypothetical protein n=1 Tax=Enterococcus faecalis TaxID=1351 RepID=UPI0029C6693A|nr:hypothetical protein [Enterococcus faecalis]WPH48375.1 hypothetical protein SHT67_14155 [Enterococcus faecalis]